ncbi:hypothetical protein [Actinomadura luteofluorescens]|uniref:hypothetical protein n=1 Tax=Actinomadura luteofluorescens TaxID=46163 RepID=UPI003D9135C3
MTVMTTPSRPYGHGKPKCGAKKRQGEGTCQRPAGWGTDHAGTGCCKLHGGNTRDHRAAALREQAERTLADLNAPPVDNPLTELARIAGQVVAWKDGIAERVNDLTSLRYSTDGGEQLRAEVALFERALDRCEKFLATMARLNIDDRLTRISEQQAALVNQAVIAALQELELPAEQLLEARRGVARHLRAVAGG